MTLLRNRGPRPLPRTSQPAYPSLIGAGMLLLLGACTKSHEASQDPPPLPAGSVAVPMLEAEAPQPPPSANASEGEEAGVPEAGADARSDAAVKRKPQPPIPSPPGGIQAPYVEPNPPPKPIGAR